MVRQLWLWLLSVNLLVACEWGSLGYNKGYAPEQPIAFSHKLHAGDYKIQCLYCHAPAERANHAAVPPLSVCMNCHSLVAVDRPAIQKITEAYNKNEPIAWVNVHMLPDFVKFNHKRHVEKFGAPQACYTCHGRVDTMEVVKQENSLSMGWCIDCHRQPENSAPTSCSTCHY